MEPHCGASSVSVRSAPWNESNGLTRRVLCSQAVTHAPNSRAGRVCQPGRAGATGLPPAAVHLLRRELEVAQRPHHPPPPTRGLRQPFAPAGGGGGRGQTPPGAHIWHHPFSDMTLGKSISPNWFFHLQFGNNACLTREEWSEVTCVEGGWQRAPFKEWQLGSLGGAWAREPRCPDPELGTPPLRWASVQVTQRLHQRLFCKVSRRLARSPCWLRD